MKPIKNQRPCLLLCVAAIFSLLMVVGCRANDLRLGATTVTIISEAQLNLPPANLPRWEPADCNFLFTVPEIITCGYVVVPEKRSNRLAASPPEAGRIVRLYVAVIHSRSKTPADPVLYVAGGPGSRTFPFVDSIVARFDTILDQHDLILYDQRGIHNSEPTLNCPEISRWKAETLADALSLDESIVGNIEANLACQIRLVQADIDLTAYTSAASAADIDDIRQALGHERLNLYGVSYGSRLALTAMRDLASSGTVRSVILDSAYSPRVDLFEGLSPNAQRAFDLLFNRCEADPACNDAYPNLAATYYALVDRLNQQPVTIAVIGRSRNSQPFSMSLDGNELVRLLFNMLYDTETIPRIPAFIAQMDGGDFSNRNLQGWLRWLIISGDYFSEGMWYSVMCGEEAQFGTEAQVRQAGGDAHPAIQAYFIDLVLPIDYGTCALWGAYPAEPFENEAVHSDMPTLILAGEFDPITPPAWGQLTAETLSQSIYVEFPNVGHGVLRASACAREISTAFLQNPTAELDTGCAEQAVGLEFVVE